MPALQSVTPEKGVSKVSSDDVAYFMDAP